MLTHTLDLRRLDAESWRRTAFLLTAFLFPSGMASVGAVALLVVSVLAAVRRSRSLWRRSVVDLPLGLLVLLFSVSAATSPFPAMAAVSTLLLAAVIALAYGTTVAMLARRPADLTPLLWAVGGGTAAAAAWGSITYLVTGQPAHTVVGYNAVGTTLATGLPILLGLGVSLVRRHRVIAAAAGAVTLDGLVLSFARGAWLGGAVGLLLFILLLPRRALRPVLLLLAAVFLAGGLGLALVDHLACCESGAQTADALVERAKSASAPGAVSDRVAMWRASLTMVRDRPWLGSGLNTFGLVYPRYQLPGDPAPGQPFAHNLFLNVAAEGGMLGLAAVVAVLASAVALGVGWLRSSGGVERVRAASVLAAAAALLIHQQVDGTAVSVHVGFGLWLLLAVMAARGSAARATTAQAG